MIIDLKSIDENGKDYNFDEQSEELFGALTDLIKDSPFKVDLRVEPLGNTYQVSGSFSSHYVDICSRCAHDLNVPLMGKINEIVVIEKPRPRNTQVSQSQQNFDSSGPSVTYINDSSLDLREFLHEMMAASLDLYPVCVDAKKCERQQPRELKEAMKPPVGHPGFEALKDFKAKH